MIDEAKIAVLPEQVPIKPSLIEEDAPVLDDWFRQIRCRRELDTKKTEKAIEPVYHSQFDVFADGALRVRTRSVEHRQTLRSEQFVYLIELNLRKILWGHNGINIRDGEDLCSALLIARHALQRLLSNPDDASKLIPGLDESNVSYWKSTELAMDLRDPGSVIRRHLERMRSPAVRRNPRFYENTSLLDGKNIKIKVYDKFAQMKDRHKTPKKKIEIGLDPITRLEVKLLKGKLTDFDMLDPVNTPTTTRIAGQNRLTGFTWAQLKAIHRSYFSQLRAVYHVAAEKGSKEKGYAAVLAAIAREHDIPIDSIYELLKAYGGKEDGNCRKIRTEIEWFMGQGSELTAEELLSDENYGNQPGVHVSGLEGCRFYVNHYGWSEIEVALPEVRRVYGDTLPPPFRDTANKPYLFWGVADAEAAKKAKACSQVPDLRSH
jgi:hypothetical protein